MPNGTDMHMATYLRRNDYRPECGNDECDECALRDPYGYDNDGYDRDGYDSSGYDRDGENRNGSTRCEMGDCYGCADRELEPEPSSDARLMNYSYRPSLRFNGDKAPYYGMELEITTDNISGAIDITEQASGLLYCKEDSSVQGLEIVSHPMSYPWAMEHFPWEMLTELRGSGATIVGEDNGLHIHVGRNGFSGSAHTFRWMKFWYRNPRDIQRIARRRSSHWGAFNPDHRAAQKEHVKRGKPGYSRSADETLNERYAAINTQNDATLEVRVFASTLRPQRAQAALQLVAGSVEYTRQLTSDAVTHRHGWEWPAFMSWAGKSGEYGALLTENRIRRYL